MVVLLGFLLRLWILGRSPVNSDEAVVGLMAEQILHGHFYAFYWGQSYGGGEPYVVAVIFEIFGQSPFSLGVTPVLLDGVAAILTWRTGRHLFGQTAGAVAGLMVWIWPIAYVSLSTLEYGFRYLALVCGLTVLLTSLRITGRSGGGSRLVRWVDWATLGLAVGVGWWATPEIAYYAVPSAVVLLANAARGRVKLRISEMFFALCTAFLGALPWLWDNVGHGYPSLATGSQEVVESYTTRLSVFFHYSLPMAVGLRTESTGRWIFGPVLGPVLAVIAFVLIVALLLTLILRGQAMVLVVMLVFLPLFLAYSPYTWFWQDGRYAMFVGPMLALLIASITELPKLSAWGRARLPVVSVALGVLITITGAVQVAPIDPVVVPGSASATWTSWHTDPDVYLASLARVLKSHHVHYAYSGYWVSYALMLDMASSVQVSDLIYYHNVDLLLNVEHSANPAWIFVTNPVNMTQLGEITGDPPAFEPGCALLLGGGPCLEIGNLESFLHAAHIGYSVTRAGYFSVVFPDHPVEPTAVFGAAHV